MRRSFAIFLAFGLLAALTVLAFAAPAAVRQCAGAWWLSATVFGACLAAGLLGWRFNQTRIAFLAAFLAVTHASVARLGVTEEGVVALGFWFSLHAPVAFVAYYFLEERGLLNRRGVLRFLLAVAPAGVAGVVFGTHGDPMLGLLPRGLSAPLIPGWLPMPAAGVFATAAGLAALLIPWPKRDTQCGGMLAGALLALAAALCVMARDFPAWRQLPLAQRDAAAVGAVSLAFLVAGAILVVGMLELAYAHAFIDPLTQIPGRRALDHRLRTLGATYAIAMVDIDHFKDVNDRYGHDVGDQALRFLASRLREIRFGTAYRYGGEEFAIVCPHRKAAAVKPLLDDLRQQIAASDFHLRGEDRPARKPRKRGAGKTGRGGRGSLRLTVSIGVAGATSREATPEAVVTAADRALYRAKHNGRNRVEGGPSR